MSNDQEQTSVMNGQQYITTQMRIIEIGKIADSLDLKAFLKCLANAEAMLPAADPEMAKKAQANLTAVKTLALAALCVKEAYIETYKEALGQSIAAYTEKPKGML